MSQYEHDHRVAILKPGFMDLRTPPAPQAAPNRITTGEGDQPEGASGSGRNRTLEGLRGFAASTVILYHIHNMAVIGGFYHPAAGAFSESAISELGPFGVLLFFMISGYLIVQSLIKYDNVPLFLKHRMIRIYPVFLVLHVLIFSLGPWRNYAWMGPLRHSFVQYALQFVSNLLFLPGVFPLPLAQKNAWSLSYEFAFYLIAAVLFFAATRRRMPVPVRLIAGTLGSAATLAFLFFHPAAAFFLVGTALYFLWKRRAALLTRFGRSPLLGLVTLTTSYACYDLHQFSLSLLFGLVFFSTAVSEGGLFSCWLRARPWQNLGRISYSLYLVHPFVLDPVRSVMRAIGSHLHNEGLALALFGAVGACGSVTLAYVLYLLVEVRFTNRFLRSRRVSPRSGTLPHQAEGGQRGLPCVL